MRLSLDPACAEARRLGKEHRRADSLLLPGLEQGRLAEVLDEQRDAAFCAHLVGCDRCQRFVRTCGACGADLAVRGHKFTCAKNHDRWRGLLAGPEPPLAHLSLPATATTSPTNGASRAHEPPPPRRVAVETAPRAHAPTPTRARFRADVEPRERPHPAPAPAAAKAKPRAKKTERSAWDVLGVRPGAPPERIRQAFKEQAMLYHPDRVEHMAPEFRRLAEEKMREINAAYHRLQQRG